MKSEFWFQEKGRDIPYNHSITHFLPPFKNSIGRSFKLGNMYGYCSESARAKIMFGPCWLTLIKSVQPSDSLTRSFVVLIDFDWLWNTLHSSEKVEMVWKNGATDNYHCTCFPRFCSAVISETSTLLCVGCAVINASCKKKNLWYYIHQHLYLLCLDMWESFTEKMNEEAVCCF